MVTKPNTLYQNVLGVTTDYLGPAAQRFIDRQIDNHLHKSPEGLTRKDLGKLVEWSRVSMALLTNDKKIIDEYVASLKQLADER